MGKLVHRWIAVTVVVSVIAAVDGGWVMKHLALAPDCVLRGQVWRLVTWTLIVPRPFTLVIVGWFIYRYGGELAEHWGEARLRRVVLQLAILAGPAKAATAAIGLSAFVGLCGVYYGLYAFAPELVGCALALAYPLGWARR